jgi:hypothetical protein
MFREFNNSIKIHLNLRMVTNTLVILNYRNNQQVTLDQFSFMKCATVLIAGIFLSKTESKVNDIHSKPIQGCRTFKFQISFVVHVGYVYLFFIITIMEYF